MTLLAVGALEGALAGLAVLAMIALPYWVLYRVFRNDSPDPPDE